MLFFRQPMDGIKFSAIAEDTSIQALLHLGTDIHLINSIPSTEIVI